MLGHVRGVFSSSIVFTRDNFNLNVESTCEILNELCVVGEKVDRPNENRDIDEQKNPKFNCKHTCLNGFSDCKYFTIF